MKIKKFILGPVSTNCYLLESDSSFLLIDPAHESFEKIAGTIEEGHKPLKQIFLTHSHWDHVVDLPLWIKKFSPDVYIHSLDRLNLEKPGSDLIPSILPIEPCKATHFFEEGTSYNVLDTVCEILHTPGHTPGGVSIYFPKEAKIFTGDTLFKGTIGNTSFPTSDRDAMKKSLQKLANLPEDTEVLPGHGVYTTLGEEAWIKRMKQSHQE